MPTGDPDTIEYKAASPKPTTPISQPVIPPTGGQTDNYKPSTPAPAGEPTQTDGTRAAAAYTPPPAYNAPGSYDFGLTGKYVNPLNNSGGGSYNYGAGFGPYGSCRGQGAAPTPGRGTGSSVPGEKATAGGRAG